MHFACRQILWEHDDIICVSVEVQRAEKNEARDAIVRVKVCAEEADGGQ